MGCEIRTGTAVFIDVGQAPKIRFRAAVPQEIEYKPNDNFVGIIPSRGRPIASTRERVFGLYELDGNPFLPGQRIEAEGQDSYQNQALEDPVWN